MTPGKAGQTAGEITAAQLTTSKRDVAGIVMLVVLLFTLISTLLILFVLIGRVVRDAMPVVTGEGTAFLTNTIGSNPATTGIWPGLYGSFIIGIGVVVLTIPIGVGAAIYLEEYAKPNAAHQRPAREHPQPCRRAVGHLRGARPDHLRRLAQADHRRILGDLARR